MDAVVKALFVASVAPSDGSLVNNGGAESGAADDTGATMVLRACVGHPTATLFVVEVRDIESRSAGCRRSVVNALSAPATDLGGNARTRITPRRAYQRRQRRRRSGPTTCRRS